MKTTSGAEGKKPAKDDDDDDDAGDSDADSVDSDCVDDLSGDEVDVSNIIEGGRRARRGRPTEAPNKPVALAAAGAEARGCVLRAAPGPCATTSLRVSLICTGAS